MSYLLVWCFVLMLIGLWSLAAWGLHALALWTVSQADKVSVDAGAFGGLGLPEPWQAWLPPQLLEAMNALLASLGPLVTGLLQAVPSLAGVLTLASWVVWGLGFTMLLVLGAGLHLLVALWRRRRDDPPPAGGAALAAPL